MISKTYTPHTEGISKEADNAVANIVFYVSVHVGQRKVNDNRNSTRSTKIFYLRQTKKVKNYFFLSFKVQALSIIRNGLKINLYITHSTRFSIVTDIHTFNLLLISCIFRTYIFFHHQYVSSIFTPHYPPLRASTASHLRTFNNCKLTI